MHNGGIPQFRKIKRSLLNMLSDECFQGITGSTDSEHIFALFLNFLPNRDEQISIEVFIAAVEKTISSVLDLCEMHNVHSASSLNLVFSDGINIIATRYRSGDQTPPSLYYNYGSGFACKDGHFLSTQPEQANEIVISSAPLSREEEEEDDANQQGGDIGQWILMPQNHMLVCVGDHHDISIVSDVYLRHITVTTSASIRISPEKDEPPSVHNNKSRRKYLSRSNSLGDDSLLSCPSASNSRDNSGSSSGYCSSPTRTNLKCNRLRVVDNRGSTCSVVLSAESSTTTKSSTIGSKADRVADTPSSSSSISPLVVTKPNHMLSMLLPNVVFFPGLFLLFSLAFSSKSHLRLRTV